MHLPMAEYLPVAQQALGPEEKLAAGAHLDQAKWDDSSCSGSFCWLGE